MKDYYKILHLNFGATIDEVKKSYRNLAMLYHPDKTNVSTAYQQFIEITEAYEVLRDLETKNEYDIIYKSIFLETIQPTVLSTERIRQQQQSWTTRGESKAKEYSQMSYDTFIQNAFTEIQFHSGHLAYIGCLSYLFIIGGLVMTIGVFFFADPNWTERNKNTGAFIIFPIIGIILLIIGFQQVGKSISNYKNEIKKRY